MSDKLSLSSEAPPPHAPNPKAKRDKKDMMLSLQAKAEMWYDLGVGVWTKISKIWSSPSPNPCRPIDALGWVWGFLTSITI